MAIFFIFRLCVGVYTGLGTGESYYFRGAYDIAFSYFDQPPLFFWLSHLSIKLFGINVFAIRLPSILFFSGTTWVLFLITRYFFNEKAAFYSVLLFNLSALYIIDGIWFQPDAPLLFFWALSLYFLVRLLFPKYHLSKIEQICLWCCLGIAMGLTGLSKYHVVFFFTGMLLFILTKQRELFKQPWFYLSFLICGIFFLPILIWNYQHDWASIRFQSSRELSYSDFSLHFDWFLRSFLGQALWLLPWIWVPIIFELIRSYKLGKIDPKYWFFFCMAVFPIVFFTLSTLWANLSYHFHWQSVGYMILFVPLGATIDKKMADPLTKKDIRSWLIFSAVFVYVVLILAALQVEAGFWQKHGPKELNGVVNASWMAKDQVIDPTMDSYDYTDLLTYFEQHKLFEESHVFVGAANWLLAGKVDWALKGKIPVRSFEEQRNYTYYFNDKQHLTEDVIFITRDHEDKAMADTLDNCSNLTKMDDVPITRNNRVELILHLYRCKDFHE